MMSTLHYYSSGVRSGLRRLRGQKLSRILLEKEQRHLTEKKRRQISSPSPSSSSDMAAPAAVKIELEEDNEASIAILSSPSLEMAAGFDFSHYNMSSPVKESVDFAEL